MSFIRDKSRPNCLCLKNVLLNFGNNSAKSWPIFWILSLLERGRNFQQNVYKYFHHPLNVLPHYLVKCRFDVIAWKLVHWYQFWNSLFTKFANFGTHPIHIFNPTAGMDHIQIKPLQQLHLCKSLSAVVFVLWAWKILLKISHFSKKISAKFSNTFFQENFHNYALFSCKMLRSDLIIIAWLFDEYPNVNRGYNSNSRNLTGKKVLYFSGIWKISTYIISWNN